MNCKLRCVVVYRLLFRAKIVRQPSANDKHNSILVLFGALPFLCVYLLGIFRENCVLRNFLLMPEGWNFYLSELRMTIFRRIRYEAYLHARELKISEPWGQVKTLREDTPFSRETSFFDGKFWFRWVKPNFWLKFAFFAVESRQNDGKTMKNSAACENFEFLHKFSAENRGYNQRGSKFLDPGVGARPHVHLWYVASQLDIYFQQVIALKSEWNVI